MELVSSPSAASMPAITLAERVYAQIKQLIFDFQLLGRSAKPSCQTAGMGQ
ncbi:hypothetical protein [Ralstonia mannitolilytica]|uniref:hypothetical protein n=1 Tax=Ralstonia mannitolilytica TaxID=105219 RepID=UPI000A70914C|nr:hypothetical protein [Ralstonia mannitolilytica]